MNTRSTAIAIALLLATALTLGLVATQTRLTRAAAEPTVETSLAPETDAYEYMAELSDEIGPRVAGSTDEREAADRITQWFTDLGYTPSEQSFTFGESGSSLTSQNIVATKVGTSTGVILVGAHYDSVASGRGAFDNASGVALMMALADALRSVDTPYTIEFVAFGAEEAGLKGSEYFYSSLSDEEKSALVLMVDFDSVATGDRMYCYSSKSAAWPQLTLRSIARGLGVTILTSPGLNRDYPYGTTGDWSDQTVFRKAGVPYLYLEATNWLIGEKDGDINTARDRRIWHTRKDTITYIEQRYPGRIAKQLQAEFDAMSTFLTTPDVVPLAE